MAGVQRVACPNGLADQGECAGCDRYDEDCHDHDHRSGRANGRNGLGTKQSDILDVDEPGKVSELI